MGVGQAGAEVLREPLALQGEPQAEEQRPAPARRDRGRILTAAGLTVFVVVSAAVIAVNGLFLSRDVVFLWLMAGLLAVSLADVSGWLRGVVTDWLPFFGALFVYDVLRGVAGDPIFEPHVYPQIDADRVLFLGEVPTVWLQEALFDPALPQWYDFAAWAVYLTHFFAVFVIAAWLWRRSRARFRRFRNMLLALTAGAFLTYVLFPAVPPWLASDGGHLGETTRVVGAVWDHLGVTPAAAIWEKGSTFANEVAAIPSLHTAYPVLIMLFFWRGGSARVRGLCLAYAVAMSLTLVYTGEHYVADVLLGWLYAGLAYFAVDRVGARLAARRRRSAPAHAAPAAPGSAS
jgi:membrane-associated phospholipid phosphatase